MTVPDERREQRFRGTYADTYGRVHAYAARRVGRDAADEVSAEVFLVAWRRFDSIPPEPLPWLYGVARNIVLRYRAEQGRQESARSGLAFERAVSEPDEDGDDAMWAAWERLSASDQEILGLVAWEELRVREAALVIGCSPSVFSVRLYRARKRLERLIDRDAAALGHISNLSEVR